MPASLPQQAAGLAALSQLEHSFFFVAQDASRREQEARVTVRIRIIMKSWLVPFVYEAKALRPSAYLLTWTGAGGGGGGGLEAQETRPPAMTDAAKARRAYFIVSCVVFVIDLMSTVIASENCSGITINSSFANRQILLRGRKLPPACPVICQELLPNLIFQGRWRLQPDPTRRRCRRCWQSHWSWRWRRT